MITKTTIDNGTTIYLADKELKDGLQQMKHYLEETIRDLKRENEKKSNENRYLKESLDKARQQAEGNTQLVNKLLGELTKLQNDIDWYKRTYEKRSLLGTIREKLLRSH